MYGCKGGGGEGGQKYATIMMVFHLTKSFEIISGN